MNDLLNPCKLYFDVIEKKVREESESFFDNLVIKSKINVEENDISSANYENSLSDANKSQELLKKYKKVETLFIILIVVFSLIRTIYFIVEIFNNFSNLAIFLPTYIILLILTIYFIFYLSKINRMRIINQKNNYSLHSSKVDKYLEECKKQIEPLLSLFDSSDQDVIFSKISPIISLDKLFDKEKLAYLHEKFSLESSNTNQDSSIIYSKTGKISGLPFVILKTNNFYMGQKTYQGTRVVSYQVYYRDSEGRSRSRTQFETLIATITKPCPKYFVDEVLYYGNPLAANLSFSRSPFYLKKIDDTKSYEKYIEKQIKVIQKEKKKSDSFVQLNNDEFEVLFHALNRDNEREFRLLFTPLGQKSMVYLIKSSPYGDDFTFTKKKKLNLISSSHVLSSNRNCDPVNYYSYSIKKSKELFVSYSTNYYSSFFFELAPLLSIPIYQQTKKESFHFDKKKYPYNSSLYEHEEVANLFNRSDISISQTEIICKTEYIESISSWDIFDVISYGYRITPKVEMVPRVAGNGRTYLVPVPYDEYNQVVDKEKVALLQKDKRDNEIISSYFNEEFKNKIKPFIKNNKYFHSRNKVFFLISNYDSRLKDTLSSLDK